jgi:hypothetical protein
VYIQQLHPQILEQQQQSQQQPMATATGRKRKKKEEEEDKEEEGEKGGEKAAPDLLWLDIPFADHYSPPSFTAVAAASASAAESPLHFTSLAELDGAYGVCDLLIIDVYMYIYIYI